MRESRWLRLLAVLLALALVAAACGDDDDDGGGVVASETTGDAAEVEAAPETEEAPEAETAPEAAPETDQTPEAETAPEPEEEEGGTEVDVEDALGTVDVAEEAANCATAIELEAGEFNPGPHLDTAISIQLASGLNPHNDQGPANFAYYSWIFESMVRQDVDGSVVPWLAKCWETNEDGDQITFYLHEGVVFHDGAPFNADAVVANVEHIKTAGGPEVLPPVAGQLGIVDSVEALDEYTVQFNLSGPAEALLLSGLIRNSGFLVSPNALGNAGAMPHGTGPYALDNTNADNTEINLTGFADYWQPQLVGAETVRINSGITPQARVDAFNAGQYDIAIIRNGDQGDVPNFTANTTVRIGFVVTDWTGQQIPQLANRDVRCAMAQALNRVGIQTSSRNPPESAIKQFAVGPNDYAYIDDLASPDFDIEAAKALFESTGEDGFTFQNGHLPGGFWPVVSSAFGGALAELGITMENEPLDPPSAGEMFGRLARGVYPVQIIAYNEPNALMSLIARTGTATFNPSGVSPDGVAELIESAKSKSFEDGEADVAAAWKIMLEECIFIINHVLTTSVGYHDGVSGVQHIQGIPITYWPHGVRKT